MRKNSRFSCFYVNPCAPPPAAGARRPGSGGGGGGGGGRPARILRYLFEAAISKIYWP